MAYYSTYLAVKGAESLKKRFGGHDTKKAAESAARTKIMKQREADRAEEISAAQTAEDRRERLRRVSENKTLFTDPLGVGGQAATIRKFLTGE